nr:hypothetical protein [Chloroflexota bacterium]
DQAGHHHDQPPSGSEGPANGAAEPPPSPGLLGATTLAASIGPDVLGALHFREWHVPYETPMAPLDEGTVRLLGELLGLDLSSVTPLRALNLLHEIQAAARASLPWQSWLQRGLRTED